MYMIETKQATYSSCNNPILSCYKFSCSDWKVTYFKGLHKGLKTNYIKY